MANKNDYFIKNGIKYYNVGEVYDNFYAGGMIPKKGETCKNILSKLQFIYEVWLGSRSIQNLNVGRDILDKFRNVFSDLNEDCLWYQNILEYEVLDLEGDSNCLFMSDSQLVNNHIRLDNLLRKIIDIFNIVDSRVNNCESLVDYLLEVGYK